MKWYLKVLKNYAEFSGRARRTEFWMFVLFNIIVGAILSFIDLLIFGKDSVLGFNPLYSLAVLIPSLAVAIRRLHDTDRSGFWVLLSFIPIIGWLILLIFYVQNGTPGANQYGNDPKSEPEPV